MPRTAPVPNIPAIPGMNPGIVVKAGGGAGGGGSAGKGNGKGGKKGAANGDGQESANGDGKDTGSCGQGAGAGCSNCGSHVTAGDPVDTDTGDVFTLPQHDVLLGGPFDLSIARVYNSRNQQRDVGLGFGWSMALAWTMELTRSSIVVGKPDGATVLFPLVAQGSTVESRGGWTLRATATGFVMDAKDGFYHHFTTYGNRALLEAIEDASANRVELEYDPAGLLVAGTDSAGRALRFERNRGGRIASIAVHNDETKWFETFVTYEYDANGDLRRVRHRGGYYMEYEYEEHRLSALTYPNGLRFFFLYDRQGRCTETWGNYIDGSDPALDDQLPLYLADNTTPAKGIYHTRIEYHDDGYREVVNAVEVKRLDYNEFGKLTRGVSGGAVTTRTYDEHGRCIARTDANGQITRHAYDERGRLIERIDPRGNTTSIGRDEHGRIISVTDSLGGTVEMAYDIYDNTIFYKDEEGAVSTYQYDQRGMMTSMVAPDGGRTTIEYDKHANPVRVTQPNAGVWTYAYDAFGHLISVTDPEMNVTRLELDDGFRVIAEHHPHGGVFRIGYDSMHNVTREQDADGTTVSKRYGGLDLLCETSSDRGYSFLHRYDREGRVVAAVNEKGERWQFELNALGGVTREVTFDGQDRTFRVDELNNCTRLTVGGRGNCSYSYDGNNNVTELAYEDGSVIFEYDANDRITVARNTDCETHFDRDLTGRVIREVQSFEGTRFEVEFTYDTGGRKIGCRSSFGYDERIQRDGMGAIHNHCLTSGTVITHDTDVFGRSIRMHLSPQAAVETQYHPMGWVVARTVNRRREVSSTSNECGFWLTHEFSLAGELRKTTRAGHTVEYDLDADSNVLSARIQGTLTEAFSYDERSNPAQVQPVSDGRVYGSGDQLKYFAGRDYEWDGAGRLVACRKTTDQGVELTIFHWSEAGDLRAIDLPNGHRLEFATDPFGRRVQKKHWSNAVAGQRALLARTVFVWAGPTMIQELHYGVQAGAQVTERRLYYYDDDEVPVAHETLVGELTSQAPQFETLFYVNDGNDTPTALVRANGETAATLTHSIWGKTQVSGTATTPLRFKGQYHDEESGLHYNRYRYYDPETGRYISADPLYGEGSDNLYRYCVNPLTWVDPLGLHTVTNVSLAFSPNGPTVTPQPRTTNRGKRGHFHSGYTARDPGKSDAHCQGMGRGQAYWESHTERKAMRWAEAEARRRRRSLKDAQLSMRGEQAPCNTCNKAMLAWTKRTGAKVTYTWPRGKSKTYSGGTATGSRRTPYSSLINEAL